MKSVCRSAGALVLPIAFLLVSTRQVVSVRIPSISWLQRLSSLRSDGAAGSGAKARADVSHSLIQPAFPGGRHKDFADGDDTSILNHWALLIAGSSGWSNYRHQADVCHAYQVLRRGGLRPAHIVVMMFDDIAVDDENPFPGQVFNSPGGPDVYSGVRIDYRGTDVNAATFLAVLEGNASALPPDHSGSGRVIASGPRDRLFVFYSDHGSPGVLGMPSGPFLYGDQLVGALRQKYVRGGYKEAVLYIEACESGSLFEGLLPANISTYVTTAANAFESSWGTYCPGMAPGAPPLFSTCLGDLYSVAWMENADDCDLRTETLLAQYSIVRNRTSHNYTYWMGSHVMQYGALAISREVAGDYQGMRNRGAAGSQGADDRCRPGWGPPPSIRASSSSPPRHMAGDEGADGGVGTRVRLRGSVNTEMGGAREETGVGGGGWRSQQRGQQGGGGQQGLSSESWRSLEQREADLATLRHRAAHAASQAARKAAQAELSREISRRHQLDEAAVAAAASLLTARPELVAKVASASTANTGTTGTITTTALRIAAATSSTSTLLFADLARELVFGLMGRPGAGRALVDDWDCLRAMVSAWESVYGPMDQYAMRHTRLLANLCNTGVGTRELGTALVAARDESWIGFTDVASVLPA